jgi:hypothetical protein
MLLASQQAGAFASLATLPPPLHLRAHAPSPLNRTQHQLPRPLVAPRPNQATHLQPPAHSPWPHIPHPWQASKQASPPRQPPLSFPPLTAGALQQAVYSRMSEALAGWVVADRQGPSQLIPAPLQALLAAGMPALRRSAASSGLQLAAVRLAEGIA